MIRNSGLILDTTKATVYTAANGTFSASFIDLLENPNIYVNVEYVGTAIDGHLIKLTDDAATPSPLPVDTNIEGVIHNNVPAGTLALGVLRTTNTAANIISHLGDSLRFVRATYALWPMPDDLIARARLTDGASFVDGNGAFMSIAHEDYDHPGAGNAAFGDIHHESFHWIAYRAYGNRFPPNPCNPPSHSADLESCEGFAMQEGSAQYYGTQSAASIGLADQKSGIPDNTVWRGSDGTGFNNNGEIVEGALERIWRLNADNPGQIRVLLADSPDSMKQFKDAYATREGTTSAKLLTFFNNGAANGIVYTRVKISTFTEGAPANASPAGTGNFKVIDNIAFLRGTVRPTFVSLTKPELRLALNSAVIDPDQKDLGYKPAVNGLTEATTTAAFTFLANCFRMAFAISSISISRSLATTPT